jgi:hypothetical protein
MESHASTEYLRRNVQPSGSELEDLARGSGRSPIEEKERTSPWNGAHEYLYDLREDREHLDIVVSLASKIGPSHKGAALCM